MQVVDGIHKVDGVRVANVWLVETTDGLVVVDTGMTSGVAERVMDLMRELGHQPGELRTIVITHADIDHVGAAAELQRRTGAKVALHELDAPVLAGVTPPQKGGLAMRALYRLLRFRPVAPDWRLADGDEVGGLRVMHVPGHTPGSIALVRSDGVIFSGDALLADKRGAILPPDPRLAHDRTSAAASAERIRAAGLRLLLAGHGAPATPG